MKNKQLISGIISILSLLLCGCNTPTNSVIPTPTTSEDKEPEGEPEETITREERLGMTPVFSKDKKSVTYGLYPKSYVSDVDTVRALSLLTKTESNGFYLYNDEYYVNHKIQNHNNYMFEIGEIAEYGKTYWFKCEPIEWQVLSYKNGRYLLLSKYLLGPATYRYFPNEANDPNNYKNSDIREYINNTFYNTAFSLNNSHVVSTDVDNSGSTTNSYLNPYACENTSDKVFLLSYRDYLNPEYGFDSSESSSDTRYCKTTDWARALDLQIDTTKGERYGNGNYWTRSPSTEKSTLAYHVNASGYLNAMYTVNVRFCLRPSINIVI